MRSYNFMTIIYSVILLCAWLPGMSSASISAGAATHAIPDRQMLAPESSIYLAQAEPREQPQPPPRSGALVLPDDYEKKEPAKQQSCVRVCSDWGETCVYDNNKGRKCRRTCKQTVMECFDQ
jgi:hypothetical protein